MTDSPLFDAPGPRARRRMMLWTNIVGAVVVVGIAFLIIRALAAKGQLDGSL